MMPKWSRYALGCLSAFFLFTQYLQEKHKRGGFRAWDELPQHVVDRLVLSFPIHVQTTKGEEEGSTIWYITPFSLRII
jgi:hypothetical protein